MADDITKILDAAEKLIEIELASTSPLRASAPTFTWIIPGPQTASVPLALHVPATGFVVYADGNVGSSWLISKSPVTVASLIGSKLNDQSLLMVGGGTQGRWQGRAPVLSGDVLYVDTLGGAGANTYLWLVVELAT